MCTRTKHGQGGVTLIELIVFIVIVSVALTGVLSSLNIAVMHSADPLLPKQALAIAEGLLEEILLKNYSDPDGKETYTGSDGNEHPEDRSTYDDIDDFKTADVSVDLLGNSYTAAGYSPSVTIVDDSTTLGVAAKKITVTVTYNGGSISLTGYRTNY